MNIIDKIKNEIEGTETNMAILQHMAKAMVKDMKDSLDIELAINFIDIKDIKKAKKTSQELSSVFNNQDVLGIIRFSSGHPADSMVNLCMEKLNPSEGLYVLDMYHSLLVRRKDVLLKKIESLEKV